MDHSDFLLRKQDASAKAAFLQSLARQALFLTQRWRRASDDIGSLARMIHVGLTLHGMA